MTRVYGIRGAAIVKVVPYVDPVAITSISPSTWPSGNRFTLTVNGSNFTAGSVVRINGANLTTTFVSAAQITAAVTAANIATSGSYNIDVTTPSVPVSNVVTLTVTGDSNFGNVLALFHFDGVDGASTFTDSSNAAQATSSNGVFIDDAQFKWGATSSVYVGGASQGIKCDNSGAGGSDQIILGNSNFTIEMWVRFSALALAQSFLDQYSLVDGNRAWSWYITTGPNLGFSYSLTGLDANRVDVFRSWSPSTGVWYHIAACRSGADLRMFVDGTQLGATYNISTGDIQHSTQTLGIGAFFASTPSSVNKFTGWMDEARVTIGTARYTANFTAPTLPFASST